MDVIYENITHQKNLADFLSGIPGLEKIVGIENSNGHNYDIVDLCFPGGSLRAVYAQVFVGAETFGMLEIDAPKGSRLGIVFEYLKEKGVLWREIDFTIPQLDFYLFGPMPVLNHWSRNIAAAMGGTYEKEP